MIDVNRALKNVVANGKVTIGVKEAKKAVASGQVKMVIVASNFADRNFGKVPVHVFKGTNVDLGTLCGKPFPISVLGIIEEGGSSILSLETTV